MTGAKRTRKQLEHGGVTLIPIMNLVCLLIPFLLYTASFVLFASVDARAPRFTPREEVRRPIDTPIPLGLTLSITDQGFHVHAAGDGLPRSCGDVGSEQDGPALPLRPGAEACVDRIGYPSAGQRRERLTLRLGPPACAYDFAALQRCMLELKEDHPDQDQVVIMGEPGVDYEVLIRAMDVTRGSVDTPLFDSVSLGAGLV